jgi:mono/diheme cytochrome c family protein
MKRFSLSVAAVAAMTLSGCGGTTPPTRAQTIAALTGVAATGQSVYTAQCVSCHQADGNGNASYKSATAFVKANTAEAFFNKTIDGVPGTAMVSYAALTNQQLADCYAYIKNTLAK